MPTQGFMGCPNGYELISGLDLMEKGTPVVLDHVHEGLDFVAFDVNTVSPPHDLGGMTAFLAGTVMLECMYLACRAGSAK